MKTFKFPKNKQDLFKALIFLSIALPIQGMADNHIHAPVSEKIISGSFVMGCLSGRDDNTSPCQGDEVPSHLVKIAPSGETEEGKTIAFWISRHEITVKQFAAFANATDYETTAEKKKFCGVDIDKRGKNWHWRDPGFKQARPDQAIESSNHPVVCVSWTDTQAYVTWLNEERDENWRLPSEAEWEYAARAGENQQYLWGR